MRRGAAVALVISGALMAGTSAHAYTLGGAAWNKRTIGVSSALGKKHEPAVRAAISAWTKSGARIRLVFVRRGGDLHIIPGTSRTIPGGAAGYAPVGMQPNRMIRIRTSFNQKPNGLDYTFVRIITHELGHALGLEHSRSSCATMYPIVPNANSCIRMRGYTDGGVGSFCRLLQADDLRGIVRRYGGRARLAPLICYRAPAPARPALAQADTDPGETYGQANLIVNWTAPAGYPAALADHLMTVASAAADRCPTRMPKQGGPQSWTIDSSSGSSATTNRRLSVEPPATGPRYGRFCVTVWTSDDAGRVSPPASIWVNHPPPPPSVQINCSTEYDSLAVNCWSYAYDRDATAGAAEPTVTIDWGDSTAPTTLGADGSGAHTYAIAGTYTVTATARTAAGAQSTATTTVSPDPAPAPYY